MYQTIFFAPLGLQKFELACSRDIFRTQPSFYDRDFFAKMTACSRLLFSQKITVFSKNVHRTFLRGI